MPQVCSCFTQVLLPFFFWLSEFRGLPYDDVTRRLKLKRDLKCKSMQWYLDNVFPNSDFRKGYTFLGEVRKKWPKKANFHPSTIMSVGCCQPS